MNTMNDAQTDSAGSLSLTKIVVVHPYTVIRAAIAMMRDQGAGCAVITDRCLTPRGIFTENAVVKLLIEGASLDRQPVCEFQDSHFACVKRSQPIGDVWRTVWSEGTKYVCFTDDDGKLVGLADQRGLLAHYAQSCFTNRSSIATCRFPTS
ncbi:CBS domain-containing protein [Stieleria varia]|uniref:CBS domain protein n=1 Tax=Stieleria varia TaxID=2528005 RepID=A0A5C6BC65_9BACT|nr:CBS domain-containing protein [Stieleria varia]TWU08124.1 CBS domain protein [Stieleria varia]